jgi:hypothetical protein
MIVDPLMPGLSMSVTGNEIYISHELYNHSSVVVSNTAEKSKVQTINTKSFYNPDTVQTVAYLMCQNIVKISIFGNIDSPIYVRYSCDYETFYSSVVDFSIAEGVDVEIVEEIASNSALNSVINYNLAPSSRLGLTTFYQNNISSTSLVFRNINSGTDSYLTHVLLGKGSSNVVDETKIRHQPNSTSEFLGVIVSNRKAFHSILSLESVDSSYDITVDYRGVFDQGHNVTFLPIVADDHMMGNHAVDISNIQLEEIPADIRNKEVEDFLLPVVDRTLLERVADSSRFYANKAEFLSFNK